MNQTSTNTIIIAIIIVAVLGIGAYLSYGKDGRSTVSPTPQNIGTPSPATSQAKINIDAVCEGALAYTTFPDGASADVFVQECKEGKHPEVIERYKASLNLDAGVEI